MKVVICGGGIGGLTLAALLRRSKLKSSRISSIRIIDRITTQKDPLGGGIGLWPPSLEVLDHIGIVKNLEAKGKYMAPASYIDPSGNTLAQPTEYFSQRFPVLCLQRDALREQLLSACLDPLGNVLPVDFDFGCTVTDYEVTNSTIKISNSGNPPTDLQADLLIGADGINSIVREKIAPQVKIKPLGYAYYRAVVVCKEPKMWNASFEIWGDSGCRFGFVPLQQFELFWFIAIPIGTLNSEVPATQSQYGITSQLKTELTSLLKNWKGHPKCPITPAELIELTPHADILRTEIGKVPSEIGNFPWVDPSGKVILLGDAAHATAPNLAQGAGLSIEDAGELDYLLNYEQLPLNQLGTTYERKRKPRAQAVQRLADMVALSGQATGLLAKTRSFGMKMATKWLPSLGQSIFEQTVSYSLGGSRESITWRMPGASSLLVPTIGRFNLFKLDNEFKDNRLQLELKGSGVGHVNSSSGGIIASLIARIAGIPRTNTNIQFLAKSTWTDSRTQVWERTFGEDLYSTEMTTARSFSVPTGVVLLESVFPPSSFLKVLRIGYEVNVSNDGQHLNYKSVGMWFGSYQLPLPWFLLLRSSWVEAKTAAGWTFDGVIKLPWILGAGTIMKYGGDFKLNKNIQN